MSRDLWVEVDTSALKHNFKQVRAAVDPKVKIMAVVKGNGYGHGIAGAAKVFAECGADMLGVTRPEEAKAIRKACVDTPILVFLPVAEEDIREAADMNLTLTVTSLDMAKAIEKAGRPVDVHIKVDTGMGRLGVLPEDALPLAEYVSKSELLTLGGVYTHFADASAKKIDYTKRQFFTFLTVLDSFRRAKIDCGLAHAATSAAAMRLPESHLDMVRIGTLLYGQQPVKEGKRLDLKTTWALKARICDIKTVKAGGKIGYGCEFTAKRDTKVGVVGVGYADGFAVSPMSVMYRQSPLAFLIRKMRYKPALTYRGKKLPVLGRVGMQISMVDLTRAGKAQIGDEVTVPARRISTSPEIERIYK
ncbi:MAG: alanine racemase [Abditibacteriota bacterium]|nr:alanine racemase [Abditibacteriota bacterium]